MLTTNDLVFIDFETYYAKEYSISTSTMQEYIMHDLFETIGVAIAVGTEPPVWYPKPEVASALAAIDWSSKTVVAHNAMFDGAILAWHYGACPKRLLCTMHMAVALGVNKAPKAGCTAPVGSSLATLADYYGFAAKGKEVLTALGFRYKDFSVDKLVAYGKYCVHDVELTQLLYFTMVQHLPDAELEWIDSVLSAYTSPQVYIDKGIVEAELQRVLERREIVRQEVTAKLQLPNTQTLDTTIQSNHKFATALTSFNVIPPVKISKTTGKETYAFAKTDKGMMALLEHPIETVRCLAEARLGLKSSIEVSRCQKFIGLAHYPAVAMPYKVSGATSHRLAGSDSINMQNLPSGRKPGQSNALRRSFTAPEGHSIIVADSGQIEPRMLAYIAGQTETLDLFRAKADVYLDMAATLYHRTYEELLALYEAGDELVKLWRATGKVGVLSLGYGAGAASTRNIAEVQYNVILDALESKHLVDTYRRKNAKVPMMWDTLENCLQRMILGYNDSVLGPTGDMLFYDGKYKVGNDRMPAFRLPDGMWITLPNLRSGVEVRDNKRHTVILHDVINYRHYTPNKLWGGSITGIIVQATAFALIKAQSKHLKDLGYKWWLNTHDEFGIVVPDAEIETATKAVRESMLYVPDWCKGIPLACSIDNARHYGDAK